MAFTAILDACVLYRAPLRDLLIRLARTNLFRARWSDQVHNEWTRNLLLKRPDLEGKLERTRDLINEAVDDCLVEGYETVIPSLALPVPDDGHVLAAAIVGRADVIVTCNLKDFSIDSLVSVSERRRNSMSCRVAGQVSAGSLKKMKPRLVAWTEPAAWDANSRLSAGKGGTPINAIEVQVGWCWITVSKM